MSSIKNYGMKWVSEKSKDIIKHKIIMEDDPTIVASIEAKKVGCCNFKVETKLDDQKTPYGNEKVSDKEIKSYIKDLKSFINKEIIDQEEY